MGKKVNLVISLVVGIAIFGIFLYKVGFYSVGEIFSNINLKYLSLYFLVTTVAFFPTAWRWKIILKAYKKKISFIDMLRYTIAGYAVSYITPSVRVGGEPLRAYMIKKEHNVDLKTGSSSIIIDKFIEFAGTAVFGLIGLILFLALPQIPTSYKIIFGILVVLAFSILFLFYYRTITSNGSFSSLFLSLRLHKISKLKYFVSVLKDVEKKMEKFFLKNKKEFLLSSSTYLIYGVLVFFEFKLLLLSFGIDGSFSTIVLALNLWGLANFFPVPAALGVLEAGQTGLFSLIKGAGSIGFALSLLIRARALLFVAIGFTIISYFGGKQFDNKEKKIFKKSFFRLK
ncbi:MAG: lysylphosphatidylglycerol synthase transmembrane domain-containing protein [Nanoarchaeota archaeon]|nr:lysylphosphatidylglycerol synthase transmembrane domain-containing protein [Nanoarchaeota archaeon]